MKRTAFRNSNTSQSGSKFLSLFKINAVTYMYNHLFRPPSRRKRRKVIFLSITCRSRPIRKGSLFVFRLGFKFFAFRLRALHLNALEDTRLDYESRIKMMQESHRKDIEAIKSSTGYVRSVESRHEMVPNLLLSNFLSQRRPIINELTVIRYNHQSATTLCKPAVYDLF